MAWRQTRRWAGIVLCAVCAWACHGDADFSDAMPETVTLNAEAYRQEITDIDRLVFSEAPFDETRRNSLARKLEELARRMKVSSDSRFIAIEVLEVRRLAEVAKRVPAKPPSPMLADQWMRIRSNVFDDRRAGLRGARRTWSPFRRARRRERRPLSLSPRRSLRVPPPAFRRRTSWKVTGE